MFLLAALTVAVSVEPDAVSATYSAHAPEVTTEPAQFALGVTQTTQIENVTAVRSRGPGPAAAFVTARVVTSDAVQSSQATFIDRTTVVTGVSDAVRTLLLSAQGVDPSNVDAPTPYMNYTVLAPSVDVFEIIAYAGQDDGVWFPEQTFIQKQNVLPLFADLEPPHVSPDALTIAYTTVAPDIAISDNALVYPPVASYTYTAFAPTIVIDGAPIIEPPSLTIAFTAPTVVIDAIEYIPPPANMGGDDAYHHTDRVEVIEPVNQNLKRAKLRLKKEEQLTEEIREIYRALTAKPETAARAEAIVAPVVEPLAIVQTDEPLSAPVKAKSFTEKADVLVRKADRGEPAAVEAEIALRMLYAQQQQEREEDDQAAIELLLNLL